MGVITNQFKVIISSLALIFNLQGCDTEKKFDRFIVKSRLSSYTIVSNKLACLSDKQLEELLKKGTIVSSGYGENIVLDIEGIAVFVKKIPLTDLERKPKNIRSTANLFNLPLFYQYGIGSAGFGAWRELAANIITTNWVLTGECENFPIMYHWRVLPGRMSKVKKSEQRKMLNEFVEYWDNSPAVRARLQALQKASAFVCIFLENIPTTVNDLLNQKIQEGPDEVDIVVKMIEKDLESTTSFMAAHGMYHFDAHFRNILTDGCRLYFADLGLAACSTFDLSSEERSFFELHRSYDQFFTRTMLPVSLAKKLTPSREDAKDLLQEYADGKQEIIYSPIVTEILQKYAPCALVGERFFQELRLVSKATSYPIQEIEKLCGE